MLKTFNVTLDIEKELYNPAIMAFSISQADLDIVELTIQINQDGAPFDLSGSTSAQLGIKKPSGLVVYQDLEITNSAEGELRAVLTNQTYIEWGIYTAEVYIRDYNDLEDRDQIAVTCPFFYYSRSAVMSDEALESFNDWTALQDLLLGYDRKPILTEGIPTIDPEYVGQMAFDTIGRRAFIAGGLTADLWQLIGGSGEGGGGGVVSWADIIGKPATFPASEHRHSWTDLDDVPTAFPPIPHSHNFADLTGTPTEFPPQAHQHPISDISGLQLALDSKADSGEVGGSVTWEGIEGKPATYPADPHTHDFTTGITGKPPTYPPSTHSHTWTEVTDKPTAFTPTDHDHLWADITDKPATFLPSAHTHSWDSGITGKPTTFPPSAHIHAITDVTGLAAELDSKLEAIPPEYLTESEGDVRYAFKGEGGTGGGSTLVEDVLTSTSTTSALSANQGRILNNTKANIDHDHTWGDITDPPVTYPPAAHTHTLADLPAELLTEAEAAGIYQPKGTYLTAIPPEYLTDAEAAAVYQPKGEYLTALPDHTHTLADLPAELLTESEAAGLYQPIGTYLTAIPPEYLTEGEGDLRYQPVGNYLTTLPPEALTEAEAAAIYQPKGDYLTALPDHDHAIADVTGLQAELDSKLETLPAHTHDFTTGVTGKPTTLAGYGITDGASDQDLIDHANWQNSEIARLEADIDTKLDAIPPEYLTEAEAAGLYQPVGNYLTALPAHTHTIADLPAELLTETEAAATYQVKGNYLTSIPTHTHTLADLPAELLTESEAAGLYQPKGTYLTALPPEALTETEAAAIYQPKGTYLTSVPLMSGGAIGGAMVGNGLGMSGNYLFVKLGAGMALDTVNNAIKTDSLNGLKLWSGTSAAYSALTPDPNTLYFVVG
jgi:hypothetical protein